MSSVNKSVQITLVTCQCQTVSQLMNSFNVGPLGHFSFYLVTVF